MGLYVIFFRTDVFGQISPFICVQNFVGIRLLKAVFVAFLFKNNARFGWNFYYWNKNGFDV